MPRSATGTPKLGFNLVVLQFMTDIDVLEHIVYIVHCVEYSLKSVITLHC